MPIEYIKKAHIYARKLGVSKRFNEVISRLSMRTNYLNSIKKYDSSLFQIVGVPRSGTTLLSSCLDNHKDTECLIEPYLAWLQKGYYYVNHNASVDKYVPYYLPPHYYFQSMCKNHFARYIGFKETFREYYHPTFPTSKFLYDNEYNSATDFTIAIIRDPRSVWASIINRSGGSFKTSPTREITETWNIFAKWLIDRNIFFIRFEDFVINPKNILSTVFSYLGIDVSQLPVDPTILHEKPGSGDSRAQAGNIAIDSSAAIGHRDKLPAYINDEIVHICCNMMEHYGYI